MGKTSVTCDKCVTSCVTNVTIFWTRKILDFETRFQIVRRSNLCSTGKKKYVKKCNLYKCHHQHHQYHHHHYLNKEKKSSEKKIIHEKSTRNIFRFFFFY